MLSARFAGMGSTGEVGAGGERGIGGAKLRRRLFSCLNKSGCCIVGWMELGGVKLDTGWVGVSGWSRTCCPGMLDKGGWSGCGGR